jgi:hypothetical protein
MRSSYIALAFTLAVGCGRDPLVAVPGGAGTGSGGSGGSAGSPVPGGSGGPPVTGGAAGGAAGASGGTGGVLIPDAAPPVNRRDAAPTPPPDAAPAGCAATVPPCLAMLATECPTPLPCVQRMAATGGITECYPNNMGVRLSIAVAGQVTKVTAVRGAMATPCYTLTATTTRMGGMGGTAVTNLVYRNGGPNTPIIGTGTLQGQGQVTLMCPGQNGMQPPPLPAGPINCAPGGTALAALAGGMAATCTNATAMAACTAP